MTAGRAPRCRSSPATQAAIGVLPVPPTVKLPTPSAGNAVRCAVSQPASYKTSRAPTMPPNNRSAGSRSARDTAATVSSPTQIRSTSPSVRSETLLTGPLLRAKHGLSHALGVAGRLTSVDRVDLDRLPIRNRNLRERFRHDEPIPAPETPRERDVHDRGNNRGPASL